MKTIDRFLPWAIAACFVALVAFFQYLDSTSTDVIHPAGGTYYVSPGSGQNVLHLEQLDVLHQPGQVNVIHPSIGDVIHTGSSVYYTSSSGGIHHVQ